MLLLLLLLLLLRSRSSHQHPKSLPLLLLVLLVLLYEGQLGRAPQQHDASRGVAVLQYPLSLHVCWAVSSGLRSVHCE